MAKVNFELVQAAIPNPQRGYCSKTEYARCDLARPAAELRAIAHLMDSLDWVDRAVEHDGALYVQTDYRVPWLVQERAFRAALAIARREVTATLDVLTTQTPEKSVRPTYSAEYVSYHKGASASVRGTRVGDVTYCNGGTYLMPEGHYGPGFAVHPVEDGRLQGYFVTSDRYDRKPETLAAALLATVLPGAGIGACHEMSYHEFDLEVDAEALADHAVAAYRAASTMIVKFRRECGQAQWGGKPSVFTDEDDAARDWLLAQVRAGATIDRVRRVGASYNDCDGVCEFTLSDGTPLAHYIVTRLQNSEAVLPLGYPFDHSRQPDEPLVPLVYNPKLDKELVAPRTRCVPFQAFQSYCAHRRRDGDRECAHPTGGGDYCGAGYCPITSQVYAEDVGSYGLDFRDDPAFDDHDWERDSMVRALHRNTERSYAWRAAGEDAVLAIVNQVIHAKYGMGIECHLYGPENMRAVRQGIADGWLVVEQEMPDFGVVVKLSESTIAKVEEQRAARAAQIAEAGKVTADAG